jgi:protein-tyrosine-phosphatase
MIKNIGICCSGNTCRSPITAIWLEKLLRNSWPGSDIKIWTAGIDVSETQKVQTAEPFALEAAKEMNLEDDLYGKLENHKSQSIWNLNYPTDLLVWISSPKKINDMVLFNGISRLEKMIRLANTFNAKLFLIPEEDNAWKVRENPILGPKAYFEQAEKLKEWSEVINARIIKFKA